MQLSRRDLGLLLPALAAAQQKPPMDSHVFHNAEVAYAGDATKKAREFFHGATHSGFGLEVHETVLGPGVQTHAPHKHAHEEIIVVFEGTAETWIEGKTEAAEQGSVIYFGSNRMHSLRNAGKVPCRYYVVELRGSEG